MKAYFTVEAACIIPAVLGIYVFLIYIMFYQYDRCVLEQDVALLVLKEQWSFDDGTEAEVGQLQALNRYPAFSLQDDELIKEKGKIRARAKGIVNMPFYSMIPGVHEKRWQLEATFSCPEMHAVEWIRLSRKIMEGIGNVGD